MLQINLSSLGRIARFEDDSPHLVLGPTALGEGKYRITAYLPRAMKAWMEIGNNHAKLALKETGLDGIYQVVVDYDVVENGYLLCFSDQSGYVEKCEDPYSFGLQLSDFDIYLYKKGELYRSYDTLGAHEMARDGVKGTRFVMWAPNAVAVSVVGNFNHWTTGMHPMTNVKNSGLWELFIPGIEAEEVYKFAIKSSVDRMVRERTDPYSFKTELRPRTGSIVSRLDYKWRDESWMKSRTEIQHHKEAMSIYEVHLGSWRKPDGDGRIFYSLHEIGEELIAHAKGLGFTHIELMPIMEHPFDGSWGYQVVNYYAPTSRYGEPSDYKWFIDKCHENGIGVILDWVPAHFPDDEYGLSMFDGTHLYDHEDPRKGLHPDWQTRIFNYGRMEVRNFLISNALFWADKFHADGIRIDAVSSMLYLDYSRKPGEWIPNKYGGRENIEAIEFLRELNKIIHEQFPGILTIAEESTAWGGVTKPAELGGLGFDYKWNMGWMHDTLTYFSKDPVYRKYEHDRLTFTIWYAFSENYILPFSHDEVVHLKGSLYSKMPGDDWQKYANLRLCFLYMFASPGKKLVFMGDEFGQSEEWAESRELSWNELEQEPRKRLMGFVGTLNRFYSGNPVMHGLDNDSRGFEWIDFRDSSQSVIAFIRRAEDDHGGLIFVFNFTPIPRYRYAIGVPWGGQYEEIMNSDSQEFGGSGVKNPNPIESKDVPFHGRPNSIELTLPPLGGIVMKHKEKEAR